MRFATLISTVALLVAGFWVHAPSVAHPETSQPALAAGSQTRHGPIAPLLRITKGRFSAYLLPESHIDSPFEFGPHFHSVVLPAARRSSTLIYEGLNGDTFPGAPQWGRTCLDDHPEVALLGTQLTARIVTNHQHSQWADLRRAWSAHGEAYANENFTAFIRARGLMINFWELDSRIHPLVEREVAMRLSLEPEVTSREYFVEHSAHERIAKKVTRLKLESIETLDDHSWAVCQLSPAHKREALERAIELFDAAASRTRNLKPGSRLQQVGAAFSALQEQLGTSSRGRTLPRASRPGPGSRVGSDWIHANLPGLSRGPALDKLRFELRNARWAQRMDEHAQARRTGLMYVLGASHLLDFEHFDGLLTLLKRRGFRVEVVQ